MVLDTSVLMALVLNEPEASDFERQISKASIRLISAATLLEATIVVETRRGDDGARELELWLGRLRCEVIPLTQEQSDIARDAWRRYGKGRHPAGLNFGDCFSYALAKQSGERLLYKGNDFAQTDLA